MLLFHTAIYVSDSEAINYYTTTLLSYSTLASLYAVFWLETNPLIARNLNKFERILQLDKRFAYPLLNLF